MKQKWDIHTEERLLALQCSLRVGGGGGGGGGAVFIMRTQPCGYIHTDPNGDPDPSTGGNSIAGVEVDNRRDCSTNTPTRD